jgi:hypothetical protein
MKKLLFFALAPGVLVALTGCRVHFTGFSSGWSDAHLTAATNVVQTAGIPAHLKGLEVDNRFGTIHVDGTDAATIGWTRKLTVRAHSGAVAQQIAGGGSRFVCHNQNAPIRLHATSTALTNIEAKTSFGTLEVHLPASLKPAIRARTSFAGIESDFPVLLKPRGEDPFAGVVPEAARISLQNQTGRIAVVRD